MRGRSYLGFMGGLLAAAGALSAISFTPTVPDRIALSVPQASKRIKQQVRRGGGYYAQAWKIARKRRGRDHISSPAQQRLAKRRKARRRAKAR